MHEIVSIHIGHCGNQIGAKYWEAICKEHGIDPSNGSFNDGHFEDLQREGVHVNFNQSSNDACVPRAILTDLDPSVMDISHSSSLFRPDNYVAGTMGTENNWAKGYYSNGKEIADFLEESIRREVEACDHLQGFQITHSVGGGTGSGVGCLVLDNLKLSYPDKIVNTYSILPSYKVSGVVAMPYNSILTLSHLLETASQVYCFDNGALQTNCSESLRIDTPQFDDMNDLISRTMCGVTASLRFPGDELNGDMRKSATNMVPLPRLKFLIPGIAPIGKQDSSLTVAELTQQMFNAKNMMTSCDPATGRSLAMAAMFRGQTSLKEIEDEIYDIKDQKSSNFVEWIPDHLKISTCDIPPCDSQVSSTFVGNNTAINDVLKRLYGEFYNLFRRRSYLHWYTEVGMPEDYVDAAGSSINEVINEYEKCHNASVEDSI